MCVVCRFLKEEALQPSDTVKIEEVSSGRDEYTSSLSIEPVTAKDEGPVSVTAKNVAGEAKTTTQLKILSKLLIM